MKHLIPLLILLLTPAVYADDLLPKLLEEETLMVVYVDLTKIDAKELVLNNRPIIEKLFGETGFYSPEMLEEFFPDETQRKAVETTLRDWDTISSLVVGAKAFLTATFGIERAYFVQNLRGFELGYIALPKTARLNVPMLKSMIESNPENAIKIRETDDFVILGANWLPKQIDEVTFGPKRVIPRPDFLDAQKEVENYPVQILVAVPRFVKKVLNDTKPVLPEPLGKIDLAKLAGGLRYKAVGIDPAKPDLYAVAQAESELAAQEIYYSGQSLIDIGVKQWEIASAEIDQIEDLSPVDKIVIERFKALMTPENIQYVRGEIIPKPQGTRFTVHWDSETVRKAAENMTPLFTPLIQGPILASRQAAKRMQCTNNLKMLGLAAHNYHDANGVWPPPYSVDAAGKPLHSWRVLVLPYLEESALYEAIRKDEPWDSEYNKQFHDKMPVVLRCPECKVGDAKSGSSYCMVVGEETFGQPPKPDAKKFTIARITDGTSNTIMFVERREPVNWMEPVDIPQEVAYEGINKSYEGISSFHNGGVNCTFCDGSVRFLDDTIDLKTLKALLTIAGGEAAQW